MKMTTEEIISDLRNYTMSSMREAADRLEELQRELDGLKRAAILPEPSRLEIAAMIYAGVDYVAVEEAFEAADALIAAAKEAK